MIEIRAKAASAVVAPEMGAALAGLWVDGRPVLRPLRSGAEGDPFAYAMNVLAPFSNRISDGVLIDRHRHDLKPNLAGEPFPIHGDAFQKRWEVARKTGSSVHLALEDGKFGPFRYSAGLDYELDERAFRARLTLCNRSDRTMPFGGGFHPWFPRSADTRIEFSASGWWPEDGRHLPATQSPAPVPDLLRFDTPAPLPEDWINAGFSGWSGCAKVWQGQDSVSVTLCAPSLPTLLVYSPGAVADFFCLEPVSHPVDAHNLPGQPGLRQLAPGHELAFDMQLEWNHDEH